MTAIAEGARPSPNIWNAPGTYELENQAVDRDRVLENAIWERRGWQQAAVLDIGCGTGFHLPRFAERAATVIGVEPHGALLTHARRRIAGVRNAEARHGSAQRLPLPDASVDLVHARWAYFFGPGCEPGLRELNRVVRRGGAAFVIDNDPTRSTFGGWFRRGYPDVDPYRVQTFWSRHGWNREPLMISWRFDLREQLEAVVRIEFPERTAAQIIAEHPGTEVDYAVNLWWRTY